MKARRFHEALAEFEAVLQQAPEFNFIHIKVGQIYFQRRNYRRAIESFHTAMELDALSPGPPQSAGWVYLKLEDLEQAEKYFRISLSLDPKFESALVGLGHVALKRQQYFGAVQKFQQALTLNPNLLSAQMGLAEVYRCQGEIDQAIAVLAALSAEEPSFAFACVQLGRLYWQKRDYAAAQATFQKARDANPIAVVLNADAQLDLAESFLVNHCLEAATDTLQETPDFLKLACRKHRLQGNIYLQQGQRGPALEQYLMAWKLSPFVVEHSIDYEADRATLEKDLELQLALERQELDVHYQVVVSLDNHQNIVGVVSLLRWQHPKRGLLIPEKFLAVAEKNGLVLPIGWWEMYEACQQLAQMRQHSPLLQWVGVNLSALQLQDCDLEMQVLFAANAANIACQSLLLEVDSCSLVEAQGFASPVLEKLQHWSIRLAMSVGTADPSLFDLLSRYPISVIKIKPEVTHHLSTRENCDTVRMAVGLAREIGVETIAIGVETPEQARQMQLLGCKYAQGTLFG